MVPLASSGPLGNSEAMLEYRGKFSTKHFESGRVDGKISVKPPESWRSQVLTDVSECKHAGSITIFARSCVQDATFRASSGIQVYGPFSSKIFGSKHVCAGLKLHFMKSLVLIRFFYQHRIWTPCPKAMRVINYLRCMMRILGEPRFDANCITFDLQIRQQMMH